MLCFQTLSKEEWCQKVLDEVAEHQEQIAAELAEAESGEGTEEEDDDGADN